MEAGITDRVWALEDVITLDRKTTINVDGHPKVAVNPAVLSPELYKYYYR